MAVEKITGPQKAAAVIVALGTDTASKIYKYLQEDEVEQLTYEIARMTRVSQDDMEGILKDFYQLCLTQKVITDGGVEYARNVLEKAYGSQAATTLLDRVTKSLRSKEFDFLRNADSKNLLTTIQNEHPQTIALILSYARPDQAAAVISELPPDKQVEVVQRIATMDRTPPDVIKIVENNLADKFSNVYDVDFTQFGGVDYAADVMNNMDRTNEKTIFDELNRKDAELSEEIRKKCSFSKISSHWTICPFSAFCVKWTPKILCMPSRGPTKKSATLFSKICPPVLAKLSVPTSNIRIMSA